MGTLRLWSADETTTRAIGAALAELLGPGDVVGLAGDLGAGKTRLVQGAADALGADGPVLSPTFMLVREYDGDPPIHHVDAYRLSGPQELEDLGLEDVLSADAVVFVEWADRVAAALPESWLELVLHIRDDDDREIEVTPHGDAWAARAKPLAAALDPFAAPGPASRLSAPPGRRPGGPPGRGGSAAGAGWSSAGPPPGRRRALRRGRRPSPAGARGPRGAGGPRRSARRPRASPSRSSPACGPRTMATATAWFSATTGLSEIRSSSSYSATICGQSVASALGASSWIGGDRRLELVGAGRPAGEGAR